MAKIHFYLLALLFVISSEAFAQQKDFNKTQVAPFFPMKQKMNPVEEQIEIVKNEFAGYNFERYAALANEDPVLCDNTDCQDSYNNLITIKYGAEGRYEEIKDQLWKRFYAAVNNDSCDTLSDNEGRWCKALHDEKPDTVFNTKPLQGNEETNSDILNVFGIFWGIKDNSYMSCAKYIQAKNVSFSSRYACRIIFSSNPSEEVNKIKRDLALFTLARRKNSPEYCNLISDTKIRKSCLDSKVKNLEDL